MKSEELQQLTDEYLRGTITPENAAALRKATEEDPLLAQELKLSRNLVGSARVNNRLALKEEFTAMLKNSQETAATPHPERSWYYMAAAIGAIVLVAAIVVFQWNTQPDADHLFAAYYQSIPASSINRGEKLIEKAEEAATLYDQKRYARAAVLFESVLANNAEDSRSKLLLANCYMNLDRTNAAELLLSQLKSSENTFYRQYAHWYLGLTYLKARELTKCRSSLIVVVEEKMIHANQAMKLLKELEAYETL